jgi:hypothetical protein
MCESPGNAARIAALSANQAPTAIIGCPYSLGFGPRFQYGGLGDGLLMHDFIQETGYFFTDYIREVKERGYAGKCYVPHDINVRDFDSGRARIQTLVSAGLKPVPVPMHKVEDRINAAQLTIPRCRFNSVQCAQGLVGLRGYCRDWDRPGRICLSIYRICRPPCQPGVQD